MVDPGQCHQGCRGQGGDQAVGRTDEIPIAQHDQDRAGPCQYVQLLTPESASEVNCRLPVMSGWAKGNVRPPAGPVTRSQTKPKNFMVASMAPKFDGVEKWSTPASVTRARITAARPATAPVSRRSA